MLLFHSEIHDQKDNNLRSGAAASIGAQDLVAVCTVVETRGRAGDAKPTEASLLLADVREQLNKALEASARIAHDLTLSGFRKAS